MKGQQSHPSTGSVQGKSCGSGHSKSGAQKQDSQKPTPLGRTKSNSGTYVLHSSLNALKESLFDVGSVPPDALRVLEDFGGIVDSVSPLPARRKEELPRYVNQMSRLLTSCRGDRRTGYMNSLDLQAAYVRYFCWWNLVRLVRLFSNIAPSFFDLDSGDVAVDMGSGPLTLPIALYLARPHLREKHLTWYCTDLSQSVLKFGERLLEQVQRATGGGTWQVVRVQGGLDVPLKRKATLVSCANFLNELVHGSGDEGRLCDRIVRSLLFHLDGGDQRQRVLLVEPGDPASSVRLTRLRAELIEKGFAPASPCTHSGLCPMSGKGSENGKWCNFVFNTKDAPVGLKELSCQAGLGKRRASLCFVAMRRGGVGSKRGDALNLRVTGGRMRLTGGGSGWYACCKKGLVVAQSKMRLSSGELVCAATTAKPVGKDGKTGLPIIRV